MIEKVMRAVKSNNKKRGRNITIGAVVGMLLSCSVVIKADVIGLEIGKENDAIIFKDGIGIKLSGKLKVNLTNNGTIIGSSSGSYFGYGIRIDSLTGDITNNGTIIGSSSSFSSGSGIDITSLTGNLANNGVIKSSGSGIFIESLKVNLTNNGTIIGSSSGSYFGYGIEILTLTGNLTNTGVVYGKTSAINNVRTISKAHNYGLLVSSTGETVLNTSLTTNNGLIFKVNSGTYTATSDDFKEFGKTYNDIYAVMGYEKKKMEVENLILLNQ